MKLLVTGGAGFIGSAFVRLAASSDFEIVIVDCLSYAGDRVRINSVDHNIKFYNLDICNKKELCEVFEIEKPEYIVHWAAETHVDKSILDASPFMKTNVIGTQNLLDLARKNKIKKFVNIATDEVYGDLDSSGQFFENTPLAPNSPYSVSKTAQDMLGRAYLRTFGLPVVTCRPSNNYGPWQYPEKLLPVVIYKALNNQKIPVYGNGKNIREWLYVDDCAQAVFEILLKAEPGTIYNIGSGFEKENLEVVKFVLDYLNKSQDLIEFVNDRPGHDFRYSLNFNKIQNEIGWKPKVDFETGFSSTIEWFKQNIQWVEGKMEVLNDFWKEVYKK